jgi:hypothetical protein
MTAIDALRGPEFWGKNVISTSLAAKLQYLAQHFRAIALSIVTSLLSWQEAAVSICDLNL